MPFLETGSFSLMATSSRSEIVSLLKVVVGMGVPLIGMLKAPAILTLSYRLLKSADRAVSLAVLSPTDK